MTAPRQVWVLHWEDTGGESGPLSVHTSQELAEAARDAAIREAVAEGRAVYWNPDDPENDNADDWDEDWSVEGPFSLTEGQ